MADLLPTAAATDIGFATRFAKVVGGVATTFAEITELTPPTISRDSVDFTHFGSPDRFREFKPGLKDAGDIAITYNLVPGATDDKVISDHVAGGLVEAWRITFPNGATVDYVAFVTKHGRATPMGEKMTGSATFKVSGKPVLTPAA